ncbi:MAG: ABC transporter permease [Fimbriiglobus sp.]
MRGVIEFVQTFFTRVISLVVTVFLLALSLLPLSALLMAFPAINPSESVLSETTGRESMLRRILLRITALITALIVLLAVFGISVELVTRFQENTGEMFLSERGQFNSISKAFMPAPSMMMGKTQRQKDEALSKMPPEMQEFMKTPLHEKMPPAFVNYWPLVIFVMYILDIFLLLAVGKVPLRYNLRNLRVRWLTNAMTCFCFVFVIALLVFLLAFVSGMNNLTENTGSPGNVFVLSDGATDELFSNLGYGDLDNVERAVATLDTKDRLMQTPVAVGKMKNREGRDVAMASKETYYSINQPIAGTNPPRRRFVSLRTLEDPDIAERVHDVELFPGGRWFSMSGVDQQSRIECVLGEGIAKTLGADLARAKGMMEVGDEFQLGDMTWVVTGIMKSEGKTFGSEIWAKRFNRITEPFGKTSYSTLILRTDANTKAASTILAHELSKRYTQQKLKAFSEPDYYAELTKTNNEFLVVIVIVAVVMSIGGVFGMMTTMFASIAQRIRDIGVLRLLGFKRWQVMISFMLESLAIALIGGSIGALLIRLFADGKGSTSTLSGGGGGPGGKSVAITIDVNFEVVVLGLLFALAMGRLGGLVPALSAMRMKILESLR